MLDAGVGLDRGRIADRDDLAEVQHVDEVAGPHDQTHVVFHHEHRKPVIGQTAQDGSEFVGLGVVQARRGLVEQQHPRAGGQRTRHLDEPGPTGGDAVDPLVGDIAQGQLLDQLLGDHLGIRVVARPARSELGAARMFSRTVRRLKVSNRWNVRPRPLRARL